MLVLVIFRTSGTWGRLNVSEQIGDRILMAAVRHDEFQSVHLPDIPRDDVGDVADGFILWHFSEFQLVIFEESVKHGLAGKQKTVALPFTF